MFERMFKRRHSSFQEKRKKRRHSSFKECLKKYILPESIFRRIIFYNSHFKRIIYKVFLKENMKIGSVSLWFLKTIFFFFLKSKKNREKVKNILDL